MNKIEEKNIIEKLNGKNMAIYPIDVLENKHI